MLVKISGYSNPTLRGGLLLALLSMFCAAKIVWGAEAPRTNEPQKTSAKQTSKFKKQWAYRAYFNEDGSLASCESFTILGEDGDYYLGRYENEGKKRSLRRGRKELISFGPMPKRKGQETEVGSWELRDTRNVHEVTRPRKRE